MPRQPGQPVIEQIWESWEWILRDKLEDANNIVRRIYQECVQSKIKPMQYEQFMRERLSVMFKELGDAK